MRARNAYIFERADVPFALDDLYAPLQTLGLSLEHPVHREVMELTDTGEQKPIDRDELDRRMQRSASVSFQLWYEADHDLVCVIGVTGGVRDIHLVMNGTTQAEQDELRRVLSTYFAGRVRSGVGLGLIFDPEGLTYVYDWDRFFSEGPRLGRRALVNGLPALFLLKKSLVHQVEGFRLVDLGDDIVELK